MMSPENPFPNELGATAVEFALLLPLLLSVLLGTMEFGTIFYDQLMLTNASREGARAGVVEASPRPTQADIEAVVSSYLKPEGIRLLINYAAAPTDWTCLLEPGPCVNQGDRLRVTVEYAYNFLALDGILSVLSPDHQPRARLNLHASTAMVCE